MAANPSLLESLADVSRDLETLNQGLENFNQGLIVFSQTQQDIAEATVRVINMMQNNRKQMLKFIEEWTAFTQGFPKTTETLHKTTQLPRLTLEQPVLEKKSNCRKTRLSKARPVGKPKRARLA